MSTRCEGRVGMTRYNFRSLSSQGRTVVASCLSLGSTTDEIRGKKHGSEAGSQEYSIRQQGQPLYNQAAQRYPGNTAFVSTPRVPSRTE